MARLTLLTLSAAAVFAVGCRKAEPPAATATATTPGPAPEVPKPGADCIPVTAENFPRAESDLYFNTAVKQAGGIGKIYHYREAMPIDKQAVVRANRDTLYSAGVFDLDAGPVTITLPEAGKRFMSMQIFNEDQYTPVVYYGKGT
jgi:hypothetical protein